ncbi:MarR family winged helix-turn-helix transcriptional regulator [Desulforamulus ferrireducens]|uniref:MarR family winged helix-turn-helix transcriptional regulator n=1 Tax=Desulforamulus ferrireducens TaxID=1833852 RepID=UPI00098B6A74|nr:MarR family transcriptional regulator [Desulforamulus ferrireducens]
MAENQDKINNELIEHLFFLFHALHKGAAEQAIQSDLTIPQKIVLGYLSKYGELSVKELSQKVRLSHSTVSGIVDRLERKELVVRRPHQQDRRITKVALTDLAKNKMKRSPQQMFAGIVQLYEQSTVEEQKEIMASLKTLRKFLDRR